MDQACWSFGQTSYICGGYVVSVREKSQVLFVLNLHSDGQLEIIELARRMLFLSRIFATLGQ